MVGCLLVLAVAVGAAVLLLPMLRGALVEQARANPQLLRVSIVADLVRDELGDVLVEPAGDDPSPVVVTIEPGMSVPAIARTVADAGIVRDPLALVWQVITLGLDPSLRAGVFTLDATLTPEAVARRLAGPPDPPTPKVTLAFRPGLRIEQVAAYLQTVEGLETDPRAVYRLLSDPPRSIVDAYPFLAELPRGASLEGFIPAGV